jgi:NAD-dependent deacetylase
MHLSRENLVVITGAGISVESGIQPFRGQNGIWEENPMEMATYRKFSTQPGKFLVWYYTRFISCLDAEPNDTHRILSEKGIKVITQNIDALHRKADHSASTLIEIHGCIKEKRKISAQTREELVPAGWEKADLHDLVSSLFRIFHIPPSGVIDEEESYRPHVLLFDEYYTDLYRVEEAMRWVMEADTILFMGTSNSVGITSGILEMGLRKNKKILVVDPNPDPSFRYPAVEFFEESASSFCRKYLQ